jgi:hypothetical protein
MAIKLPFSQNEISVMVESNLLNGFTWLSGVWGKVNMLVF